MDREILFRGKRDNGEWVEGYYTKQCDCCGAVHMILHCAQDPDDDNRAYYIIPETVGQYTGLTDKNGKKIFEGDIVDFNIRGDDESYGVVKYSVEETEFYLAYDNLTLGLGRNNYSWELEVIGNIYDNPELLEESE